MRLCHPPALVGLVVSVLVATAAPAVAGAPTGPVAGSEAANAIHGSYLVVLRPDRAHRAVGDSARQLVDRHGGTVGRTWSSALRGFELRAGAAVAGRLAADPSVALVEQNRTVRLAGTQTRPPSWGLDRIDQAKLPLDAAYSYPDAAGTVHAYVIDTGVRTSHRDFGGRAGSGYDAVDGGTADDCNGHGTHVAATLGGTSYGVAKRVRLVAVRVLDCSGTGSIAQVVTG
ncbi:S8 family serine peptidase, partial [Micromonospora zhanjiangensis]